MSKTITVGISDLNIAKAPDILVTYALGSCVGICLYDPMVKLAGLSHIMLPSSNLNNDPKQAYRFADTAIVLLVKKMEMAGARSARMKAKIAGGARMFEVAGGGNLGNIGQRNIESVHMTLRTEGVRLLQEDVGGTVARTLLFDAATGQGCVRCYGKPELIF